MKAKIISVLFICILIAMPMSNAKAVNGTPDVIQAGTLVVPLMESAISGPENTLTIVINLCGPADRIIHWEMWDIDGNNIGLSGNQTLGVGENWVSDMGSIVGIASPGQLTQLTDGSFYRGFMTVDIVSSTTVLPPTDGSYPFL